MSYQVGDDGELDFIEVEEEKPKRKRKPQRYLRGCLKIAVLLVFFFLSSIGGFAYYFLRNPNALSGLPNALAPGACNEHITTISVAAASVLFQQQTSNQPPRRLAVTMDRTTNTSFGLRGNADSISLANDGIHIAEARYEVVYPHFFIYTWKIDEYGHSDERMLTDGQYPSWSPDNRQIAFFRSGSFDRSGLYVMDADGSNAHFIRNTYAVDSPASWSPDGKQLVISTSDFGDSTKNLYIVNLGDGSEQAVVKNGLKADFPAWSPDGKSIVYISHDIYSINPDGSNRHNLTNGQFQTIFGVGWSPDSMSLALLATDANYKQAIYVMDQDGAGLHTIYQTCY